MTGGLLKTNVGGYRFPSDSRGLRHVAPHTAVERQACEGEAGAETASRRLRPGGQATITAAADHESVGEDGRFADDTRTRVDIDDVAWKGTGDIRQVSRAVRIGERKGDSPIDRIAGPDRADPIGKQRSVAMHAIGRAGQQGERRRGGAV